MVGSYGKIIGLVVVSCLMIVLTGVVPVYAGESDALMPARVPLDKVKDTVDWLSVPEELRPSGPYDGARELPGERLGLIGPIIAKGGSRSKPYVVVYDSAGALVGGMLIKEAQKNPEKFQYLLQRAMERSRMQNAAALRIMTLNGSVDN